MLLAAKWAGVGAAVEAAYEEVVVVGVVGRPGAGRAWVAGRSSCGSRGCFEG